MIDLGNPAMLNQLRTLVQQNPAALQPLVQAIAQSNPQLAEALNQDPEGVLSLLAGGAAGDDDGPALVSTALRFRYLGIDLRFPGRIRRLIGALWFGASCTWETPVLSTTGLTPLHEKRGI